MQEENVVSFEEIAFGIALGLLFVSIVILFCVVLIKLYIKKIKTYTQQLYEKDLDFQKALNETIIETQEQVLNNISQDLHDDAGQQLTFINFQLENMKLDSPELKNRLEPLSASVRNLSQSIRSISHSLNNQLLLQQDLLKAIATEVARLQHNSKVKIHFNPHENSRKVFTSNEKIIIYRIFQEIINNIFKHAKATQITISTQEIPHFRLIVADNGKGFDIKNTGIGKQTLGLQSINNRAEIINYTLDLASKVGEGTTITLSENNAK